VYVYVMNVIVYDLRLHRIPTVTVVHILETFMMWQLSTSCGKHVAVSLDL